LGNPKLYRNTATSVGNPFLSLKPFNLSVTPDNFNQQLDYLASQGYQVNWIAYPYGNVNETVANIAQQTGYVGAFGTNHGMYQSTNSMFTLPRIRIGGSDTIGSFAGKLP